VGGGMSLRSPLGRVLGLGSARDGVAQWWVQRVSSVALVPLTLWFVISMAVLGTLDYGAWVDFLQAPFNAFMMVLLIATLAYHSFLGVCVVIEDYVHSSSLKISSLLGVRFAHVLAGGAAVFAVLRIAFGNHLS
jgi:succinate dehydrogenase / fumarate reductase membrane anchor subunit